MSTPWRLVQLLVLIGVPLLLLGAYFPACEKQVAITPTTCDPFAGCQPAGGTAITDAEKRMSDAQLPSLISLGVSNWNGLEPCLPCANATCSDLPAPPAGVTKAAVHNDCVYVPGAAPVTCQCYYNLTGLSTYVNSYVKPTSTRNGRNLLLQLAPVFTYFRTLPPYLTNKPFTGTSTDAILAGYEKLWDKVQSTILDPLYDAQGNGPVILLSMGNEINAYLDNPCLAYGGTTCPDTDKVTAWNNYLAFFPAAKAYVDSKFTHSVETVTTIWKDGVNFYGLEESTLCNNYTLPCFYSAYRMAQLYQAADVVALTYYPDFYLTGDRLSNEMLYSLGKIIMLSHALNNKGFMVQEAGFPSGMTADGETQQSLFLTNMVGMLTNSSSPIGAVNFHQLYDFSQKIAPGFGVCTTTQDCATGAWAAGLKQDAFTCSSAHTCNIVSSKSACTTNANCAQQVGPGSFCCNDPTACTVNTCVLPSACDLVSSVPPQSNGTCASGQIKTSAGCADPNLRKAMCSWGFRRSNGQAKASWNSFVNVQGTLN